MASAAPMKVRKKDGDEMCPSYTAEVLKNGVRGKHYRRYRESRNIVLLDPDIARAFPSDRAVNEALRSLLAARGAKPRRRRAA
jgi:alpha-beta hydrolase superfamily lysophospholipase